MKEDIEDKNKQTQQEPTPQDAQQQPQESPKQPKQKQQPEQKPSKESPQQPKKQQEPTQQAAQQQPQETPQTSQHTIKSLTAILKEKEIKLLGMGSGLNCPVDLLLFKDRFEFDENLNILNEEKVIENLKTEKPYLFKQAAAVPKTDNVPARVDTGEKVYTMDEVSKMTPEDFRKNKSVILSQMMKGWIK